MDIVSSILSFINIEKLLLYFLYTALGALGSFVGWLVFSYNSLVSARRRADEMWANIAAELKRRNDLVPNLVESVRGYMTHERETLEKVTAARTAVLNAETTNEKVQAENAFSGLLKSLFAVAENYPNLKASQNFLELQREFSQTENKIQEARRSYNEAVRDLNVKMESIPLIFVAKFFMFKKAEFFEVAESEKEVPKVKFS